ncbi:3-oxoacyl-ACP synthase III [Cellulomonas triticagri]|uniref:3-oxoacyl-ACP synthase III n=1 Tax=Cellulomonas triticagri TaxID=2483352 RepID=A0A3M2JS55_9CELL|nr:3-oxoacyl-ACP synthase III [Cellulomonas triticagri]RMI13038.1 3-oxoacyl-ACP synthase III [Cellulomonas triticagri]
MSGNATTRFENVSLLSVASHLPSRTTTSAEIQERLAPTLRRLRLPRTVLERVAGVHARRTWAPDEDVDDGTVAAGTRALAEAGVAPGDVGLLINTSVTRKHLEPSVAVRLHHGLGLGSAAVNFDIANACLGFINGLTLAATMIEAGQVRYALVVDGEDADDITEHTVDRLLGPDVTRDDVMQEFATLTLGSGSAAAVLGRTDENPGGHRLRGGITRAGTQHHGLCVGNPDAMVTDARALLDGGLELVVDAWRDAEPDWRWSGMDRYITHQVSRVHTDAIVKAVGLDRKRVPTTFGHLGNVGPASVPLTLVEEQDSLRAGDRVLLMGVGSGINTAMLELQW